MSTKRRYELKARAEKAAQTRRRITEATVALHQEVGPARTTVAEVARRAGVQRLTVYNHFPDERDLLGACQAHYFAEHPFPDLEGLDLEGTLAAMYRWYRETQAMNDHVLRDVETDPALQAVMAGALAQQEQLVDGLAAGRGPLVHAAVAVALDYFTWRRLSREGLGDDDAAALMARAVGAAATSARR